ncbi:hypothetical protein Q666_02620 [Marinobacter sp. ES-1]|uniref:toxin VasX n=1 Tax=Marinobacter sp. ES-1 TaxID=1396858 RepID=UPI0003B7FBEE|nr:toxin VasX [Marinobacter sp. ES-1]ERP90187.1 hypothetical protein Q666_02620 [Marinobacter sp. ES-1]
MTDTVNFSDETRDRSVVRKAEYDDADPKDLVLTIPSRNGGQIKVPLLKQARSNIEREDYQENTLLRVKPLAEIESNLPVKSGGVTVYQGKGVALLRPGYLYVFRNDRLWRELEIGEDSRFSDIDFETIRPDLADPDSELRITRTSSGEWLDDVLIPVFLQGQAVMHDFRMAYSEVQWDWSYIEHLEKNGPARNARTTGVGPAWATSSVEGLSFESGFVASRVEDVSELRERDLGIELMLEKPSDFALGFDGPADAELCVKLGRLLEAPFDLSCEPGEDQLVALRQQPGIACLALPDPLFKARHSMSQLHLALHYLDAVDASIRDNPMAHSAMLIRQAIFDPRPNGQNPFAQYASAVDRSKLDQTLKTVEKQHAIAVIDRHLDTLRRLLSSGDYDAVLEDYRTCQDVAICEGYLLVADNLNLLQQIPGVLQAQGVVGRDWILQELRRWVLEGAFLSKWAPETAEDGAEPLMQSLEKLVQDTADIDEERLNRLNMQSLVYLEKQLNEQNSETESGIRGVANAGKVSGMIAGSLNEWSSALLAVGKRLMEGGHIQEVELPRIMQGAHSNFALGDPSLRRIDVMTREGAIVSGSIIGVNSNGMKRGLTDFDRTEGVLTRAKDYLYADLMDDSGRMVASTSPARMSDEIEEAIQRVAGTSSVFAAPDDHPEARKLSLLKVDLAKRANEVVDGPAVSRGLVALAAFNIFIELNNLMKTSWQDDGLINLNRGKLAGATADLIAASLKLSEVLGRVESGSQGNKTRIYKVSTRPLFDMKNWVLIGERLKAVGSATLVKVAGLATFLAGAVGAGLSYWEMRISLANKDFDAAIGHAVAMTGSLIVLASPLMHTLLAIPGWGWAIFGLAMAVGGGIYAASVTDDTFEQLIKRGPWGTLSDSSLPGMNDKAYYSQLLTMLSPVQVTAQRYVDVEPDPALVHPDFPPAPDDYVITVQLPLVSRIKLHHECEGDLPVSPFRLVVQEVAYQTTTTNVPSKGVMGESTSTQMYKATPLTKVTARQSLPQESGVRFLVKREIDENVDEAPHYRESLTTQIRVGLQATLGSELGPLVFPTPVFGDYEPFDLSKHDNPPPKERNFFNPFAQPESPYWFFTEVGV